jgi:hypothetical protein
MWLCSFCNSQRVQNVGGQLPGTMTRAFQQAMEASSNSDNALVKAGSSPCSGCEKVDDYESRSRPAARDGYRGADGYVPEEILRNGRHGSDGEGFFEIIRPSDRIDKYYSKFYFVLVDFDIVDENADDIFEPGECIVISNIRISNTGGMPSPPNTSIPVCMESITGVTPIQRHDTLYIPKNIPPGETAIVWGEIRARIDIPDTTAFGHGYRRNICVKLFSTMPQFDVRLKKFDVNKNIVIQYPDRVGFGAI